MEEDKVIGTDRKWQYKCIMIEQLSYDGWCVGFWVDKYASAYISTTTNFEKKTKKQTLDVIFCYILQVSYLLK